MQTRLFSCKPSTSDTHTPCLDETHTPCIDKKGVNFHAKNETPPCRDHPRLPRHYSRLGRQTFHESLKRKNHARTTQAYTDKQGRFHHVKSRLSRMLSARHPFHALGSGKQTHALGESLWTNKAGHPRNFMGRKT